MFERILDAFLGRIARFSQRIAVWHAWPFLPAIAIILGHRVNLRSACYRRRQGAKNQAARTALDQNARSIG